jgi:hypothetical protein
MIIYDQTACFFQIIMGLMGGSALCILIKALLVVGVGSRLIYFHLSSFGMINCHSLILLLSLVNCVCQIRQCEAHPTFEFLSP